MIETNDKDIEIINKAVEVKRICIGMEDTERRDRILFEISKKLREVDAINNEIVDYPILMIVENKKIESFKIGYANYISKYNIELIDSDIMNKKNWSENVKPYRAMFVDCIEKCIYEWSKSAIDINEYLEKVSKLYNKCNFYVTMEMSLTNYLIDVYLIMLVLKASFLRVSNIFEVSAWSKLFWGFEEGDGGSDKEHREKENVLQNEHIINAFLKKHLLYAQRYDYLDDVVDKPISCDENSNDSYIKIIQAKFEGKNNISHKETIIRKAVENIINCNKKDDDILQIICVDKYIGTLHVDRYILDIYDCMVKNGIDDKSIMIMSNNKNKIIEEHNKYNENTKYIILENNDIKKIKKYKNKIQIIHNIDYSSVNGFDVFLQKLKYLFEDKNNIENCKMYYYIEKKLDNKYRKESSYKNKNVFAIREMDFLNKVKVEGTENLKKLCMLFSKLTDEIIAKLE